MAHIVVEGNAVDALFNGEIDVLLHCANCQGIMGSGIAREIAHRIPSAQTADTTYSTAMGKNERMLGTYSVSNEVYDAQQLSYGLVYNLYGQFVPMTHKRAINYGAITEAMIAVRSQVHEMAIIGVPWKMGSDRAGGDWNVVMELVLFVFRDYNVVFYKLPNTQD